MIKVLVDYDSNVILGKETVLEAMKKLDEQVIKTLFILDAENRPKATITDGDVRRAILNGISVNMSVDNIAHYAPTVVNDDVTLSEVADIMSVKDINAVPVVDYDGRMVRILYKTNLVENDETDLLCMETVIMAGGKGTRLYPYTKILPKPLIPIMDTPICERIIDSLARVGCNSFYMIVNYKKSMIKSYFSDIDMGCRIEFIDENIPLGTGGGLKLLDGRINETFIMTNCDILIMEDVRKIVKHHKESKNDVTMVCSLKNYEIPYGVVNVSDHGEITSFDEKPHMSFFTNTGYYILEPCIMNYIGVDEEIGMPDIIDRMRLQGKKVGIYPISENAWLDMGQFDSMEGMERRLRQIDGNLDS